MAPSSFTPSASTQLKKGNLFFDPGLRRNRLSIFFNAISGTFAAIAVLPLFLVLAYVLFKGGSLIRPSLFTQLPPAPGSDGGGIGNAILGTLIVTLLASLIALPVGIGGGIYLAEYSQKGWFSRFVRFGNEDKRVGTAESDLEQRLLGADLLVIS